MIHWVEAHHADKGDIDLIDRLFTVESPASEENFLSHFNQDSLIKLSGALVEPSVKNHPVYTVFQLERQGYFCLKNTDGTLKLSRVISLRDSWK